MAMKQAKRAEGGGRYWDNGRMKLRSSACVSLPVSTIKAIVTVSTSIHTDSLHSRNSANGQESSTIEFTKSGDPLTMSYFDNLNNGPLNKYKKNFKNRKKVYRCVLLSLN
jgi:hypothetical protein